MNNLHSNPDLRLEEILKKINIFDTFYLPFWWYHLIISQLPQERKCTVKCNELAIARYSSQLAVCTYNRAFIDEAIAQIKIPEIDKRCQIELLFDVGMAYYDLGFREEGIDYLEQASTLLRSSREFSTQFSYILRMLCCRLTSRKDRDRQLSYAKQLHEMYPEDTGIRNLLAKVYLDCGSLEEAKCILNKLKSANAVYDELLADYYLQKGEYSKSASMFDRVRCSNPFWPEQYDYKKAVAYFKADQIKKCRRQARKIGMRLQWDRFYSLAYLESEGISRVPEVDRMISCYSNDNILLRVEKSKQIFKRLPRVLWCYLRIYYDPILYLLAWLFIVAFIVWREGIIKGVRYLFQ